MKTQLKSLLFAELLLAVFVLPAFSAEPQEPKFESLFDGNTFDGWEGNLDWFRIEDKAVVAGSLEKSVPRNEFLCTKKTYGDFELKLKAKLAGKGANAGIQFRSSRIPNHHEVKGYQCDMGIYPEQVIWGSLYDESRRNKFLAHGDKEKVAAAYMEGDWNEFKIRCEGNHIQIWLNGVPTVDYTETEKDIAPSGIIGLQIHGGEPSEASYKDIEIRELKSDDSNK